MVRTQASKHFLLWPKMEQPEKNGKTNKRKVTAMDLNLNRLVLWPFDGYTSLHKQIGHMDFLYNMRTMPNDYWKVVWLPLRGADSSQGISPNL